jgi:hypothetical protein
MIAMMGTILVPLFTHYRSPSPPVQAALAGGLQKISALDHEVGDVARLQCKDGKPVANQPKEKFDADGYATEEWELVK